MQATASCEDHGSVICSGVTGGRRGLKISQLNVGWCCSASCFEAQETAYSMWAIVFPPILNSILGFEEEELKDGYHWLTTEFYSERYLILIVLPFNSL